MRNKHIRIILFLYNLANMKLCNSSKRQKIKKKHALS